MSRFTKPVVVVIVLLLFFPFITKTYSQELKDAIKLSKSEQFKKASSMFKYLIQQTPSNGDLYYFYGRNFLDKYYSDTLNISLSEMADSAKAVYELGIQQDPANPLNLVGLGGLDLIKKKIPEAQAEFAKAMALLPSKANKQLKMDPAKHSRVLIEIAESYVTANVHDTANVFVLLHQAEKLDSKNPNLYIVKGDVYFYLLNDGSKAISNYNEAQRLDPKSPEAKLRIGQLWMRARNYTDALSYYQEVVKMDSTFAPAYRELGYLLSRANRNAEAQKNYKKFLALSTGNTSARITFVNILLDLKNYFEAIYQLNLIMNVDSSENTLNRALAYSYYEVQLYDKGLYYIQKFIKNAKPEKILSLDYSYYGKLLTKNKQDSLAAEMYLKAYDMDQSKVDLLSELAASYYKQKKYKKSIEIFSKKIALGKASSQDYYTMGKAYFNDKDYINADTTLGTVITLQPENLAAILYRARTKSYMDSVDVQKGTNFTGYAVPFYKLYIEKSQADSAKYIKERSEALDYMAFYYYCQYSLNPKSLTDAENALKYWTLMTALNPNEEKALKVKPVIELLKLKLK